MTFEKHFTAVANKVAYAAGLPLTFLACCAIVVGWAVSGPFFGFSDTWQLIINTGTTIVTFLMVFLIQNTQNRDNAALHAKLDELIRVGDSDNKFIGIEHLTDQELEVILEECEKAARELHVELRRKRSHHKAGAAPGKAVEVPAMVKKAVAKRVAVRKPAARRKPA